MKVKLLSYTPLEVADIAICKCYDNKPHIEDSKRLKRIKTVANVSKHASVIEHLVYCFDIDGVSRALLQEDARHRIGSMTVKSTRYTLQELKDALDCELNNYLISVNETIDYSNAMQLQKIRFMLKDGIPNDQVKYMLPEAYKTSYVRTFNARALQNFFQLRTDKKALWEIQLLAKAMFDVLPEEHKPLFEEFIK